MANKNTEVKPFGSRIFRREDLMNLDPVILRALLRERTHHNIEVPLYPTLLKWKGKPISTFRNRHGFKVINRVHCPL